jgi:hypothetical protein
MSLLSELTQNGFLELPTLSDEEGKAKMKSLISNKNSKMKDFDATRGYQLLDTRKAKSIINAVLTPEIQKLVLDYLDMPAEELIIASTMAIHVKPNTPQQIIHRDHSWGSRQELVFAVDLDNEALGTVFYKGSHQKHVPCAREGASVMERQNWETENASLRVTATSSVAVFDSHLVHSGGANTTDTVKKNRIFFVVRSENYGLDGDNDVWEQRKPIPLTSIITKKRKKQ